MREFQFTTIGFWISLTCSIFSPHVIAQDFDRQIAPIIAQRCLNCHSGPEPKGELDLSQVEKAMLGGETGKVIVPSHPEKSPFWEHIETDQMPPKKPLTTDEKGLIKSWIAAGAKWGTERIDPFRFTTEHRAGIDWWSLQPLQNLEPPRNDSTENERMNPIDRFVDAKLAKVGLVRSLEADKRTLIRRLAFDLLGLPPTRQQVEAFLADDSEQAYDKLVDRFLESPHYGERWARHWLDVVRFGESNGFEYDEPRDNAWPYRNWVIDALNRDLPYDEFVRMQIAGDILLPNDLQAASAVGFLVAGPHNKTLPSNDKMRMSMAQDELEDLVGIVGQTFLGLTVNCARCHDHKFDPITQREYYQMVATLTGVQHGDRTFQVPLPAEQRNRITEIDSTTTRLRKEIDAMENPIRDSILRDRANGTVVLTPPPKAYATWEFDEDFRDTHGRLDAKAKGSAKLENGFLVLDGKTAYLETSPLPIDIEEKTLESWIQLDRLDQRGGGVIGLQKTDGSIFDAIVFGEREPKRWMAGSNGFVRTKSFQGLEESEASSIPIHFAIVYQKDGTIVGYRNGLPYGDSYRPGEVARYPANSSQILFGLRHGPTDKNRLIAGRIQRAQFYDRALSADEVAASAMAADRFYVAPSEIQKRLTQDQSEQRAKNLAEIKKIEEEKTLLLSQEKKILYTCIAGKPGVTKLLVRGDVSNPTEEVAPSGLNAIVGVDSSFGLSPDAPDADRRMKLANWITHSSNPLFARVMVNRMWHHHFGQGIVVTPSDFGYNGGRPSHPELLDWLALSFQKSGYRLKSLHRLIVNSATYRQSSVMSDAAWKIDADNRLLWRRSPQRLDAEAIRDATLLVTGKLDEEIGGKGYRDVRHLFYKGSNFYETLEETGPENRRRTLYRFTPRGGRNPFLDTFDCPDPSATTPKRASTTTPLQSLAMMNNAFVFEMSDQLAMRVTREAGEDKTRQIELTYLLTYGREANQDEVQLAKRFVDRQGLPAFCRVLLNSNEFLYVR